MIPAKKGKAKADPEPVEAEDDEAEEDDDEDGGEDEYRVEEILKHDFDGNGSVIYQIKWLGYEDEGDLTWEPVENLYVKLTDVTTERSNVCVQSKASY